MNPASGDHQKKKEREGASREKVEDDGAYRGLYGMSPASGDHPQKKDREGASRKKVEDDDAGPPKKIDKEGAS